MFKSIKRAAGLVAIGAGVTLATVSDAFATVDVTSITAAATDVAAVGAAVFAVIVGVKAWKWVRAAA